MGYKLYRIMFGWLTESSAIFSYRLRIITTLGSTEPARIVSVKTYYVRDIFHLQREKMFLSERLFPSPKLDGIVVEYHQCHCYVNLWFLIG